MFFEPMTAFYKKISMSLVCKLFALNYLGESDRFCYDTEGMDELNPIKPNQTCFLSFFGEIPGFPRGQERKLREIGGR